MKNIGNYESGHSVNPLYFIIGEIDGYIEKSNWNKYLIFAFVNKNKEVLTKNKELSYEIKFFKKKINDKPGEYGKDSWKSNSIEMIICL